MNRIPILIALILSMILRPGPVSGQVINGDFSRFLIGWTGFGLFGIHNSATEQYAILGGWPGGPAEISQIITCPVPHGCEVVFEYRDLSADGEWGRTWSSLSVLVNESRYDIKGSASGFSAWLTHLAAIPEGPSTVTFSSSSFIGSTIALDNVRLVTAVPVAPTGWGRIKAMYGSGNTR